MPRPADMKAAAHDDAQPDRDMAEQPPIGLVVPLPGQSHQCGEIGRISQRARSFTCSCAGGETLHANSPQDSAAPGRRPGKKSMVPCNGTAVSCERSAASRLRDPAGPERRSAGVTSRRQAANDPCGPVARPTQEDLHEQAYADHHRRRRLRRHELRVHVFRSRREVRRPRMPARARAPARAPTMPARARTPARARASPRRPTPRLAPPRAAR